LNLGEECLLEIDSDPAVWLGLYRHNSLSTIGGVTACVNSRADLARKKP